MNAIVRGNFQGFLDHGLTDRELEFTLDVANGMTDKEIAREVGLSPESVKKRIFFAMTRLGVNRRAALIAEAMRQAIIAPLVVLLCSICAFQSFLDLGDIHRAQRTARSTQRGSRRDDLLSDLLEFV